MTSLQDGANSAFQEAIGDTIMISVESPKHLQRIGILQNEPNEGIVMQKMFDLIQEMVAKLNQLIDLMLLVRFSHILNSTSGVQIVVF